MLIAHQNLSIQFQEVMSEFGVDATRLCILSGVSPQSNRKWSNDGQ
jgi:leucyl-tRNA synthetase